MVNTRAKGERHELAVTRYLEAQGYRVERNFWKATYYSDSGLDYVKHDLFGAFDIAAIRLPAEVRFIQVTAGGDVEARKRKAFGRYRGSEVWQHVGKSIYIIHRVNDVRYTVNTLERPKDVLA